MRVMSDYVNSGNKLNNAEKMNREEHANDPNAFYSRFDCHDFSAGHRMIRDKLSAASSQEADRQGLSTTRRGMP